MSSEPPTDKNGTRHITSVQYFHFWSICCVISLIHQASLDTFNKASKKENKCPLQVTRSNQIIVKEKKNAENKFT